AQLIRGDIGGGLAPAGCQQVVVQLVDHLDGWDDFRLLHALGEELDRSAYSLGDDAAFRSGQIPVRRGKAHQVAGFDVCRRPTLEPQQAREVVVYFLAEFHAARVREDACQEAIDEAQ